MPSVNAINSYGIQPNYVNFKGNELENQNNLPEMKEKRGMSTTSKVMIGLGALATMAIGGILLHKGIKAKQFNKLIETFQKENEVMLERINAAAKPSETAGKTVEESIQNVFGPNNIVKPHTYDKSKETVMCIEENLRGFSSVNLTPENKIINEAGFLNDAGEIVGKTYTPYINKNSGITEKGERYVTFNFPSYKTDTAGNAIGNAVTILSKNGELTPVQQDLLKIIERHKNGNLTEEELNLFKDLTLREMFSNGVYPKGTFMGNYDAVLSLIQTLANKC